MAVASSPTEAAEAGLSAVSRVVLGFGLVALDANNDGKLDLAQANGHVTDLRPSTPYAMASQLSWETGLEDSGTYPTVLARSGRFPGWDAASPRGDSDNDGRSTC